MPEVTVLQHLLRLQSHLRSLTDASHHQGVRQVEDEAQEHCTRGAGDPSHESPGRRRWPGEIVCSL